jgi:hypothetical protein
MTSEGIRRFAIALAATTAAWLAASATPAATATLLKPPLVEDPRKAVIQQNVRSAYPELFGSSAAPGWVALTLLLNPDLSIKKGFRDETRTHSYTTPPPKAFEAMGADAGQYGDRVQLEMRGGTADQTRLYVRAYLPKSMPGTTGDAASHARQPGPDREGPSAPNDDPAVNRAIAENHFPDLHTYTTPNYQSVADFWVLLDREGRVLSTGRRYLLGQGDLKVYLESLYPGIRTDGFQPTELRSNHGRPAVVNFTWLAVDSPVKDLAKADLSRRGDVALYANITGDGTTAETTLAVLHFGSPSIVVCDDKDLDLEVTATDGGAGTVIIRARVQQVTRPPSAEFEYGQPHAVAAAWSAESPPVRVRYGGSAEVPLTDQKHRTWKILLLPDRMSGALQPH